MNQAVNGFSKEPVSEMRKTLQRRFSLNNLDETLDRVIGCIILDEELIVIDCTSMTAQLANRSKRDIIGASFSELFFLEPMWSWATQVTDCTSSEIHQELMHQAVKHGIVAKDYWVLAPNHMLYRCMCQAAWNDLTKRFVLWFNVADTAMPTSATSGMVCEPLYLDKDGVHTNLGTVCSFEDMQLLRNYCKSDSVRELAGLYKINVRTMEARLRSMAERHGYASITAMTKDFMRHYLATLPNPTNTVRIMSDQPTRDLNRFNMLPRHHFPHAESYIAKLKQMVFKKDQITSMKDKVFGKK